MDQALGGGGSGGFGAKEGRTNLEECQAHKCGADHTREEIGALKRLRLYSIAIEKRKSFLRTGSEKAAISEGKKFGRRTVGIGNSSVR